MLFAFSFFIKKGSSGERVSKIGRRTERLAHQLTHSTQRKNNVTRNGKRKFFLFVWKIIVILFSIQHKLRLCTEAKKSRTAHTHCSLEPPTFLSAFGALHTTMLGLHIKPQQHVFPDFVFVPFIRITTLPSINLLSQQHALL